MTDSKPNLFTQTLVDFDAKPAKSVRPPEAAKPPTREANDAAPNAADLPPGVSPCGPSSPVAPSEPFVEKRSEERIMMRVPAVLQLESGTIECSTFDVSARGVKLKLNHDLFKNVRVNIANFGEITGEITGEIIWRDDKFVGIKFDEDQGEIVRALTRVAT